MTVNTMTVDNQMTMNNLIVYKMTLNTLIVDNQMTMIVVYDCEKAYCR